MRRHNRRRQKKWKIERTSILILVFILLSAILLQRLFSLQIIHGQEYADNFSLQTTRERTLKSTRGNILDCRGNVLATNELSYSVTLEDNGSYASTRLKNLSLNGEIYRIIKLIEATGDSIDQDFHIIIDEAGRFAYDVEGVTLARFKADVYGHSLIDDLEEEEANASAEKMIDDLYSKYGFESKTPYTEEELASVGLPSELTSEELLKIITVRYALWTTSFRKYMPITVASDVSEETVASILENQNSLQGVDVQEDSIRVYPDGEYFASLIGYTGKISTTELADLSEQNPDMDYSSTSIVGKSGMEQVMETTLQGKDGSEQVRVDNLGKVLEVYEDSRVEPTQGNDVYLTIDKDLQIAAYKVLEQKIAGIVAYNIRNIKSFETDENTDGSMIPIPIYDVYYALINNSVIDISHFLYTDASETERKVQAAFDVKLQEVFDAITQELTGSEPAPYSELDTEMQNYMSYIVNDLLMDKTGILSETAIDKNDSTYKAWKTEESISLQEFLTYAAGQNWIDLSQMSSETTYLDSAEIYRDIAAFIADYLKDDTDFAKLVYKYLLFEDRISGEDLCQILYDQGVLSAEDGDYAEFLAGDMDAVELMRAKISNLEITPAQLALDPCSGSMVIVDPNTGDTKACVSYPGYDNNRLANNMDVAYYRQLSKDLSTPFYNKATQERTAPGSTFKPVTAAAGMMEGVIDDSTFIYCDGSFDRFEGEELSCWWKPGHGSLSIRGGIQNSCNVFFSETAYLLGLNEDGEYSNNTAMSKIMQYSELFNLDKKSGLEIPEASPQISDSLPIPSAIGQGTHNYTTSQLARYVATLANRGTSYNITLLDKTTDTDGNLIEDYKADVLSTVELDDWMWDDIQAGMKAVITDGSVSSIFQDLGVSLAGKTGTAQQSKSRTNHGLFVCYAPAEQPTLAMAVRIAYGYSSTNAALAAKDVLNYYFGLKDETEILTGKANSEGITNATQTD